MRHIYLTSFHFYPNILRLNYSNNTYCDIELTPDSGRIVWRWKNLIKHTGIILGVHKSSGKEFYIHNHPQPGKATIVESFEFSQGNTVYYQEEKCINTPKEVIAIGLDAVIKGIKYKIAVSNCQHLTNQACSNKNQSQDLNAFLVLGFAFLAIGVVGAAVASK